MNIFQKCLILVSVPLVCELGFVGALTCLLHQTEIEVDREAHAKDILSDFRDIHQDWTSAAVMAGTYAYSHRPMYWRFYKQSLANIERKLDHASTLVKDNAAEVAALQDLRVQHERAKQLTESCKFNPYGISALFPVATGTTNHPFLRMQERANDLTRLESDIVEKSRKEADTARARVKTVLGVAIAFNILLTLALTVFVTRAITNRLRSVMDNAVRLAKRAPLLPEVGGGDEIAELDRVFHRTAKDLEELETFKRELTAMVTHELRTPLTSIQGFLTLMRVGALGQLPELAAQKVQAAENNATRLIRLINDLLDIDKMEAGKLEMTLEPTPIRAVIDESVEAVRQFASEHSVTLDVVTNDQCAMADKERLVQVVINLISNAVKYSPPDSVVRVEASAVAGSIEVKVIDHGRGIPDSFKDKIFERFQQVEMADATVKKGTGLGLAICKAIVEQQGGSIGVESVEGKGSTFWFRLPQAEPVAIVH